VEQIPTLVNNDNDWPPSITFHLHVAVVTCEEFVPAAPERLSPSPTINLHRIIDPNNYSSLGNFLRVSAYVYRFITNIRKCNNCQCDQLTATETDFARIQWIKTANIRFTLMKFPTSASNAPVTNVLHQYIHQLRLFIEDDQLLQCGGRIHNTPLTQLAKFPYLLPPKHRFTALVVHATHVKFYHSGVGTVLCQSYWISRAR